MIGQITHYFHVTKRDRRWGFQVTGAGHAVTKPHQKYPPGPHPRGYDFVWKRGRRLEEFALLYLVAGQGSFESKHQPMTSIRAGQAVFLFPGEWHRYHPVAAVGWEEYWVTFGGTIVEAWQEEGFLDLAQPVVPRNLGLSLAPIFEELLRLVKKPRPEMTFALTGLCHLLIGQVLATSPGPREGDDQRLMAEAADYLRLHADEPVDLPGMAARFGMSYSGFRRAFTRNLGTPPHRFHQQARIAMAKELLGSTNLPLKALAEHLHYPSEFYLMQRFKQHTGLTPTQWRTQGR